MVGDPGNGFKCAPQSLLNDKFNPMPPQSRGLGLENQAFDFSAAVAQFGELDAKLPPVIWGGNPIAGAVQA